MSKLRLNLGCGNYKLPGFIDIDIDPKRNPGMTADVKKIPLGNGSCIEIYASNIVEHLPVNEVGAVFKEWLRLLEFEGKLWVIIPDFDRVGKADPGVFDDRYAWGGKTGEERRAAVLKHTQGWTGKKIKDAMEQAGFDNVSIELLKSCAYLLPEPAQWQSLIVGYKK